MEEQVIQPGAGGSHRRFWIICIVVLALIAAVILLVFRVNQFSLEIVLQDEQDMQLEYGTVYEEPGAQVFFKGTLFLTEGFSPEDAVLTVDGSVDSALGEYTVRYSAQYRWLTAETERRVSIVDTTPPEIELVSDPYAKREEGKPYKEEGFTATDNHDGDLTEQVNRQELYGRVVYKVSDSSGNTSEVEREIPLYDGLAPTILLEGEKTILLQLGRSFEEPGFLALDNVDGELTELVKVEGEVNCFKPGIYPITYTVSDSHKNWGFQVRTVEVVKASRPEISTPQGKVIYLTFDDGPGPYTDALLDLLKQYGIKATFFVTDSGHDALMKRIVDEGHSIGIHTVNHDYNQIYRDPESYFADLYAMQDIIYRNTGVETTLLRFPGGSSNLVSRQLYRGLMSYLTEAVQNAGFQYFDWNVDSNDAGGATQPEEVFGNVVDGVQKQQISIVLQHDTHPYSVNAVEDIILWGLGNGYTFLPLTQNSPNCHHPIYN